MKSNFDKCLAMLLEHEGGYVNSRSLIDMAGHD